MTIDAAKTISEIDRRIKKLERIKEVAGDPEALSLLKELLVEDRNGGEVHPVVAVTPFPSGHTVRFTWPHRRKPKKGDVLKAVRLVAKELGKNFTGPAVESAMTKGGFKFEAENPTVAVGGILRKLAKWGEISLVRKGQGRQPNVYSALE